MSTRSSSGSSTSSTRGAATVAGPAPGLEGGWEGWKQWFGVGRGASRGPGVRAAFYALVLGLVAVVVVPFLPIVPVDDRGEPVPMVFRSLYLEARTILSEQTVEAHNTSAFDANGPLVLLQFTLPLLVLVGVIVAFRRSGRSTPLTIGMLVLAVLVLLLQMTFFLPSMIAIAIASFQVRRVEMAGRVAEQAETKGRAKDEPDEDADLDDEDLAEDDYDGELSDEDEYEDDVADELSDQDEYEVDDSDDDLVAEYGVDDSDDDLVAEYGVDDEDDTVRDEAGDDEAVAGDESAGDGERRTSGRRRR